MSKKIWEDLEKVGKTFFQSTGAKKSKIVDKITSKLEVLKRDGAKIVLVENNHENMNLLTRLAFLRSTRLWYHFCHTQFLAKTECSWYVCLGIKFTHIPYRKWIHNYQCHNI
jgi:hypothetical protein